jgi:hypothetical protein
LWLIVACAVFALIIVFIAIEQINKATDGAFLIEMEEVPVEAPEAASAIPWRPHP